MENVKLNKRLSKSIYMERKLNLDTISALSKTKIKNAVGVKSTKGLIKEAEKQGIDLGKRKETQEKRAFEYFGTIYNNEIEEKNNITKNKRKEITKFKNFTKNKKNKLTYKFTDKDVLIGSLKQLNKGKYLLDFDNKKYTLNQKNIKSIIDGINSDNTDDSYSNSDDDVINNFLRLDKTFTFTKVKQSNKTLIDGSFFKHTHKTDLDLDKYQIFNEFTAEKVKVNCFIQSLICADVEDSIIEQVKVMMKCRDIPQKKIKEVAEKLGLHITIKSLESNKNLRHYGDKTLPEIKLGLIDNHYFYIDEVEVNSYALKNYDKIKHINEWYKIRNENNKKEKRYITSYEVVKILMENKDTLLTPITDRVELDKTIYYDQEFPITSLEYYDAKPNEYKEKKEDKFFNVFFDFETTTDGEKHKPYLCCCDVLEETFYGEDSGYKMLHKLVEKYKGNDIRLIAHNAGYDVRFIMNCLKIDNSGMIERGKFLLRGYFKFYYKKGQYIKIEIQDSYALIPEPLRNFNKLFGMEQEKEIMPYNLYSSENVKKKFISIDECIDCCKKQFDYNNIGRDIDELEQQEFINKFLYNCKRWNCINNNNVDILEYSSKYCKMDCEVLSKGYNKFKQYIKIITGLNINNYISLASVADTHMLKQGVYEGVFKVNGIAREFIQKCMVGGRTMCAENIKHKVNRNLDDFDAVSLYPSAMERLGGYCKGLPKVLNNLSYNFLQSVDGYFIEIKIKEVNKHYKFPLMSFKTDEGIRNFTNDMVDRIIYVDKISLEDLIKFHKIKFEIIKGYYYDEGRNPKVVEVIRDLFNERVKQKKLNNPIQNVYKLLMNSAYGKTLLKPIENETKYITKDKEEEYVSKYFDYIKEYEELPNGVDIKIKQYKTINDHYNNCICGIEVLSMSKRIMNEVMCLAEDNDLSIYYQDTDSMHIHSEDVKPLADKYREVYGKELIGKNMCQFHVDFSSNKLKGDLKSVKSIFLGKKCYVDVLEGDEKGVYDYHIRLKGVSGDAIKHYAYKNNINVYDVYEKMYNGEEITFDLCCDGKKISFDFKNNMEISTINLFERKIKF